VPLTVSCILNVPGFLKNDKPNYI